MALTFPDNIFSPNENQLYSLTEDLRQSAESVQNALTRRANLYVGTSSERVAASTLPNGSHWQDTDGASLEHVKLLGSWVPVGGKFYSGTSAQRNSFTNAPDGSHWQDTDGSKLEYVKTSTEWRLSSTQSGTIIVSTGALSLIGSTGVYGKSVEFDIPVVVDESTQTVILTSRSVGNGWGFVSLVTVLPESTSSKLVIRFIQVGSSTIQTLRLVWSVVPLTN